MDEQESMFSSESEAMDKARDMHSLLVNAIVERGVFTCKYGMSRPATVSDYDAFEKALNGWFTATLNEMGAKIPRNRRFFRLNMQSLKYDDEDGDDVTITIDFAKFLPPSEE